MMNQISTVRMTSALRQESVSTIWRPAFCENIYQAFVLLKQYHPQSFGAVLIFGYPERQGIVPKMHLLGLQLNSVFWFISKYRLYLSYFWRILWMKGVIIMMVNTNNLVSLTEANRNFSKVARLVDERGSAVILKNNAPRYLVIDFAQAERVQEAADDDIMRISSRLIAQNREAYEELAK